ncbi:hypothetical protein WDW86_16325 [Bdellovibrionota bacterium FG-2]
MKKFESVILVLVLGVSVSSAALAEEKPLWDRNTAAVGVLRGHEYEFFGTTNRVTLSGSVSKDKLGVTEAQLEHRKLSGGFEVGASSTQFERWGQGMGDGDWGNEPFNASQARLNLKADYTRAVILKKFADDRCKIYLGLNGAGEIGGVELGEYENGKSWPIALPGAGTMLASIGPELGTLCSLRGVVAKIGVGGDISAGLNDDGKTVTTELALRADALIADKLHASASVKGNRNSARALASVKLDTFEFKGKPVRFGVEVQLAQSTNQNIKKDFGLPDEWVMQNSDQVQVTAGVGF